MAAAHRNSAMRLIEEAEQSLREVFARIDGVSYENERRVLDAFRMERIAPRHFAPSSGYGYDDIGRDALERVFAYALQAEDALVRPHFASGTHAIFTALAGLLSHGETMLCLSGKPYDTLDKAIGFRHMAPGSLQSLGVIYKEIALLPEGGIDVDAALAFRSENVRMLYLQRSRGYAWRRALHPETDMRDAFTRLREAFPKAWIVVDNCYGEFVCETEPCAVGADVCVGSLIKNPGGGLAPTGGYIAGKKDCIERIAHRMSVPGLGREIGSYAASYAPFYQGLFMAPHTVAQALRTAALFAAVFERLGMESKPGSTDARADIVQAIRLKSGEALCAFCQSIQAASPVDSYLKPEPWAMPGYSHPVIMAAGTFVQGASIELSADGPMREPYTAYLQGGLSYAHGRLAVEETLCALLREESSGRGNQY